MKIPYCFECEFCKKTFKYKSQLVIHKRTHTEINPYKCEFCCKNFKQKHKLKRHMLVHSGKKIFHVSFV